MEDTDTLGMIRTEMKRQKYTQTRMAGDVQVSRTYLNQVLKGHIPISRRIATSLVDRLDIDSVFVEQLMIDRGAKSNSPQDLATVLFGAPPPQSRFQTMNWIFMHDYTFLHSRYGLLEKAERRISQGSQIVFWGSQDSGIQKLKHFIQDLNYESELMCIEGPSWLDFFRHRFYDSGKDLKLYNIQSRGGLPRRATIVDDQTLVQSMFSHYAPVFGTLKRNEWVSGYTLL